MKKGKVYIYQISIHKKNIYFISQIKNLINSMVEHLSNFYEINFKNTPFYFGYIFEFDKVESNEYNIMLKSCKNKRIKYCFYDVEKGIFVNKDKEVTKDITETITEIKYNIFEFSNLKRLPPQIKINDKQKETIKNIYKK